VVTVDANGWVIIISAIGVVLTQITDMVLSYMRDQRNAKNVSDVKDSLAQSDRIKNYKLDSLGAKADLNQQVTDQTHDLVNSRLGALLHSLADVTRWRAEQTKLETDIKAADEARAAADEHDANQRRADQRDTNGGRRP
jgi:hypothetical protein